MLESANRSVIALLVRVSRHVHETFPINSEESTVLLSVSSGDAAGEVPKGVVGTQSCSQKTFHENGEMIFGIAGVSGEKGIGSHRLAPGRLPVSGRRPAGCR